MYAEEHDAWSNAIHAYYTSIEAMRDAGVDHEADRLEEVYKKLCADFERRLAEHDRSSK